MNLLQNICFLSAFLLLGLVTGCGVTPMAEPQQPDAVRFSTSEEISLGQEVFPRAVQQMGGQYGDPLLKDYLQRVGQRLAQFSQRPDLPYRFVVVNDSRPNAFAFPGGHIAVSRGLLAALENEAQLAAVLGHQLGHVTARHWLQGMRQAALTDLGMTVLDGLAAAPGGDGALARQAGKLAAGLLETTYSRQQEQEADRLGVDCLVRAGYDPRGVLQLQEIYSRKIAQGDDTRWLTGLLRVHPFAEEHMRDLQRYIAERHAEDGGDSRLTLGQLPFSRAVAGLRSMQRGYQIYDRARQLEAQGQLARAIADYLQAAAAAPEQALILTALGTAYLKADDLAAGQQHLARAVEIDGDYYRSRLGLGFVLQEQGRHGEAIRQLEASMDLLPTLQAGFLLARAYEDNRQTGQAIPLYRAVALADPQGRLGQAASQRLRHLDRP